MYYLFTVLNYFFRALEIAIFAYFIASLIAPRGAIAHHLGRFLEPLLAPFRRMNWKLAARFSLPLDFTLLFALIAIDIARWLLYRVFLLLL